MANKNLNFMIVSYTSRPTLHLQVPDQQAIITKVSSSTNPNSKQFTSSYHWLKKWNDMTFVSLITHPSIHHQERRTSQRHLFLLTTGENKTWLTWRRRRTLLKSNNLTWHTIFHSQQCSLYVSELIHLLQCFTMILFLNWLWWIESNFFS